MPFSRDEGLWAHEHFGGAALSDVRRVRRVVAVGRAMAEQPGRSIPQLFDSAYEIKATYNLFRHPEATPENLQAGHRAHVREALREPGTHLLLEDTSEISWAGRALIPGLGPVGPGKERHQGFLLHSTLAVRWGGPPDPNEYRHPAVEVLGLADQLYEVRKAVPAEEKGHTSESLMRKSRERESAMWSETSRHLGAVPQSVRWVRVCDRGADIYEFLLGCRQLGHGFVVRASQNRCLSEPAGQHLFELARDLQPQGILELRLRERPRHPARQARLGIASSAVILQSPRRPGAERGKLAGIPCTVVRVWDLDPPPGVEGLEWLLLTDDPAESWEASRIVALQYATRWLVEDFHKALKTGLGAERLQLETAHALFAAISVMSVDALRLLDLRERLRVTPEAPASDAGLSPLELQILRKRTKRDLVTVKDVALAIGRLGGHMNRKADGMPGLITLWRGQKELQALVSGARLGLQLKGFG